MNGAGHLTAHAGSILLLFCDQFRIDLIGCYGNTQVRTPNIDALAADGMAFERACTPTPLCSPARASLMSGMYPHAHHMFNNSSVLYSYCRHPRPDLVMLPAWAQKNARHETAYYGKWHVGTLSDLAAAGFDHYVREQRATTHPTPGTFGPFVHEIGNSAAGTIDVPMEGFPDVMAADLTLSFLNRRDMRRPFLATCAFPGPHSPWVVPEEFGIRYDAREIAIWPNRHDDFAGKPLNQKRLRLLDRERQGSPWHAAGDDELREMLAVNFSYIELIDEQIGRIVAHLKRTGQYEDTTIIFTADHGDMAGAHGFMSKGAYMYDETVRIPLVIKPTGEARGQRISALVNLTDVTATIMHLATGAEPADMDGQDLHGRSLLPLIDGGEWPRQVHYGEYHGDWYGHTSIRMVTDGEWKLVWNMCDLGELYDLEKDPDEMENRFSDPNLRTVRERYWGLLLQEAERLNDGQALHASRGGLSMEDSLWQSCGADKGLTFTN